MARSDARLRVTLPQPMTFVMDKKFRQCILSTNAFKKGSYAI